MAALANTSFESPALSAGVAQDNPAGSTWTWPASGSGEVSNTNASLGGMTAPNGTQVAYLGSGGVVSQSFTAAAAGAYRLTFSVGAQAAGVSAGVPQVRARITNQTRALDPPNFGVVLDWPVFLGAPAVPTGAYAAVSSPPFLLNAADTYQLSFTNVGGGTGPIFLDFVQLPSP